LNPVEVTNKPQKSGNTSEFQKGARFFFEIKRRDSFCGFQSGAFSGRAMSILSRSLNINATYC
jgi:hypothetical protein